MGKCGSSVNFEEVYEKVKSDEFQKSVSDIANRARERGLDTISKRNIRFVSMDDAIVAGDYDMAVDLYFQEIEASRIEDMYSEADDNIDDQVAYQNESSFIDKQIKANEYNDMTEFYVNYEADRQSDIREDDFYQSEGMRRIRDSLLRPWVAGQGVIKYAKRITFKEDGSIQVMFSDTNKKNGNITTYTFDKGSNTSRKTKNGSTITISGFMDSVSTLDIDGAKDYVSRNGEVSKSQTKSQKVLSKKQIALLNSLADNGPIEEIKSQDYDKQSNDLKTDVNKVIALALELDSQSDLKVTPEHRKALIDIIKMFSGKDGMLDKSIDTYIKNSDITSGAFSSEKIGDMDQGIYVNVGNETRTAGNQKGPMETYVHEMLHPVLFYVLRGRDPHMATARRQLEELYDNVINDLTVEDLMPTGDQYDKKYEREIAEVVLSQMKGKNGMIEFFSYGLTHESMINKLKKTSFKAKREKAGSAWEIVKNIVSDITNVLLDVLRLKKSHKNQHEALMYLSMQMHTAHIKAIKQKENDTVFSIISDKFDALNDVIAEFIEKMGDKISKNGLPKKPPEGSGKIRKIIWIARNIGTMLSNKETRPHFKNVLTALGLPPEGMFQQFMSAMTDDDNVNRIVEKLGLLSVNIDGKREVTARVIGSSVNEAFTRQLKKKESESITESILETDAQALIDDNFSVDDLLKIMSDDAALDQLIKETTDLATNGVKDSKFVVKQAMGLGRYMVEGKGSADQLMNAANIARGFGNGKPLKKGKNTKEIDKLASLYAIKYSPKEAKNAVVELSKEELDGIKNVIDLHKATVLDSKERIMSGEEDSNYQKGYIKEIFNEDVDIKIISPSELKKWEGKGYKKTGTIPANPAIGSESKVIVESRLHMIQNYNKQALRMLSLNSKGLTLTESVLGEIQVQIEKGTEKIDRAIKSGLEKKEDRAKLIADLEKTIKKKASAKSKAQTINIKKLVDEGKIDTDNMIPIFDKKGRVTDYRFVMDKKSKYNRLKQDKRVSRVLGRMHASIVDKTMSSDMNKQVIDAIIKDAEDNYNIQSKYGKNYEEYVFIGGDNLSAQMPEKLAERLDDSWKIIPAKDKKVMIDRARKDWYRKIKAMKGNEKENIKRYPFKGIPLRRDLVRGWIGERDASMANAFGKLTPTFIKKIISFSEMILREITQIFKVDVIFRTLAVPIGNIFSNLMLSVQMGVSPNETLKLQLEGLRELKKLESDAQLLIRINSKILVLKSKGKDYSSLTANFEKVKARMENNTSFKLVDDGMLSSIIDDVNPEDTQVNSRIGRWFDEKTESMPAFVRTGANYAFLTEKTAPVRAVMQITRASDFVSRYALMHANMRKAKRKYYKKHGKEMTKKELEKLESDISNVVLDTFINYNVLDNKALKWFQDMGFAMFVKFFIRIQRVIKNNGLKKPIPLLLSLLGQELLLDVEDVTDHSLLTKNYGAMFHNPIDTLFEVGTPSLLQTGDIISGSLGGIY